MQPCAFANRSLSSVAHLDSNDQVVNSAVVVKKGYVVFGEIGEDLASLLDIHGSFRPTRTALTDDDKVEKVHDSLVSGKTTFLLDCPLITDPS